jgi:hypothetical protein
MQAVLLISRRSPGSEPRQRAQMAAASMLGF